MVVTVVSQHIQGIVSAFFQLLAEIRCVCGCLNEEIHPDLSVNLVFHGYIQNFTAQFDYRLKFLQNLVRAVLYIEDPLGLIIFSFLSAEDITSVGGENAVVLSTHQGNILDNDLAANMEFLCQSGTGQGSGGLLKLQQDLVSAFITSQVDTSNCKIQIIFITFLQKSQFNIDK